MYAIRSYYVHGGRPADIPHGRSMPLLGKDPTPYFQKPYPGYPSCHGLRICVLPLAGDAEGIPRHLHEKITDAFSTQSNPLCFKHRLKQKPISVKPEQERNKRIDVRPVCMPNSSLSSLKNTDNMAYWHQPFPQMQGSTHVRGSRKPPSRMPASPLLPVHGGRNNFV